MLRPHGSLRIETGGRLDEHDTITCGHCNRVYVVPHKAEETDARPPAQFCYTCKQAVCPACMRQPPRRDRDGNVVYCVPFQKRLDAVESGQVQSRRLIAILEGHKV